MLRREFVGTLSGAALSDVFVDAITSVNPGSWRKAFPALRQQVNGRPLVYLDSAATTLRPQSVIDALTGFYSGPNANPGAALHTLARQAAREMEAARAKVAFFVGATDPLELIFTRGTTEGLNLVAATWGRANVRAGDEILIGLSEHASNMQPWKVLAAETGARLVTFGVNDEGEVDLSDFKRAITSRTRIVAFSHVSNVLGLVNPAREMCAMARGPGRIVVIDGAQSVPHLPINVHALGCDFLAFSSHKMLGPMGVGALWGRRELLDQMPPYQMGSNMAHEVEVEGEHYSDGALKFSAGSPNTSGPVGFAAALDFLQTAGWDAIRAHEHAISERMFSRLARLPRVRLLGSQRNHERVGVFSFTVEGRTPKDLLRALDQEGIAIRAGDLASLPLLRRMGTSVAARASCYLYTTIDEVDYFATVLERAMART